jgi:hypothetical protein
MSDNNGIFLKVYTIPGSKTVTILGNYPSWWGSSVFNLPEEESAPICSEHADWQHI